MTKHADLVLQALAEQLARPPLHIRALLRQDDQPLTKVAQYVSHVCTAAGTDTRMTFVAQDLAEARARALEAARRLYPRQSLAITVRPE